MLNENGVVAPLLAKYPCVIIGIGQSGVVARGEDKALPPWRRFSPRRRQRCLMPWRPVLTNEGKRFLCREARIETSHL